MAFLLDTCVVSEFFKKRPDEMVSEWFGLQTPEVLFLSALTIGELKKGTLRLPPSRKKDLIAAWIDASKIRYRQRVLNFNLVTSEIWARIRAESEAAGRPLSMVDSLIAATAVEHHLVVATRNVKDFLDAGVDVYNPWEFSR